MTPNEVNKSATAEGPSYQHLNVKNYDAIESGKVTAEENNTNENKSTNSSGKKCGMVAIAAIAITALVVSLSTHENIAEIRWATKGNESDQHTNLKCTETNPDPIATLKEFAGVENVQNGAVAADDARCSDIGNSILRDHGGNAIDAAVATMFCLGVVNPAASGNGGGAFLLYHTDANPDHVSADFHDRRKNPQEMVKGKKVTEFIDCREIAPSGASMDMFEEDHDASWNGGKASAIPGLAKGLGLAHSRHGKLPWATLIKPAMELARDGVVVDAYLAHAINLKSSKAKIFRNEHIAALLTKDNDGKTLLKEGDIWKNPALAETFKAIMEEGPDAMYKGELGKQLAEDIQNKGGIITHEDLINYKPNMYDPIITKPGEINGFTMVGAPPPSSGGAVVIGAARFLSGYKEQFATFRESLSVHRLVEALKHAYSIRMSLSDPEFFSDVTENAVKALTEGDFMESLRKQTKDDDVLRMSQYGGVEWGLIKDGDVADGPAEVTEEGHDNRRLLRGEEEEQHQHDDDHRNLRGFQYLNDHGTSHLSVLDKDGNAVTITATINTYFGSGIASPSTGIILNSQMDDFASPGRPNHYGVAPSESNFIQPGKKPLSSISPTLVFRPEQGNKDDNNDLGKIIMVLGASGGPKIPTAVLQVFVNYILEGMSLYDAIAAPRIHDQLLFKGFSTTLYDQAKLLQGPTIEVSNRTKEALIARGHSLAPVPNTGTAQAIVVDMETGLLSAYSDPRKGGRAAGY